MEWLLLLLLLLRFSNLTTILKRYSRTSTIAAGSFVVNKTDRCSCLRGSCNLSSISRSLCFIYLFVHCCSTGGGLKRKTRKSCLIFVVDEIDEEKYRWWFYLYCLFSSSLCNISFRSRDIGNDSKIVVLSIFFMTGRIDFSQSRRIFPSLESQVEIQRFEDFLSTKLSRP